MKEAPPESRPEPRITRHMAQAQNPQSNAKRIRSHGTTHSHHSIDFKDFHQVYDVSIISDPNEPKTIQEDLRSIEHEQWRQSSINELKNFYSRMSWTSVPRQVAYAKRKIIIGSKWVIKKKQEIDESKRYKSRVASKGYMQIPGVNHTERCSPVATDTTTRIVILICLFYGWTLESIDIEEASLEGDIEVHMYMDWPPGMVELGQIDHEETANNCIQLNKNIYGMLDAALIFYKAYSIQLMQVMGMTRSKADAFMFIKQNESGKTVLIMSCPFDYTMIGGTPESNAMFKQQLKERFSIKERGRMTKHLGIKYEWKHDDDGQEHVVATMGDLTEKIVRVTERHLGKEIKEQDTPARTDQTHEQDDTEILSDKMYRTIVRKIMCLTQKLMLEGINAAQEMPKFFVKPQKPHWKAVEQFVGYLKKEMHNIKLTYRKPLDLRFVAVADSNIVMDKLKRRSVSGAIYTLGGSFTGWACKAQTHTTLMSTEADYAALATDGEELMFVNNLMSDIEPLTQPRILYGNNEGDIALVKNRQSGTRTKHIDIKHHFLRDLWEDGTLKVKHIHTDHNEADICTKNTSVVIHHKHRGKVREAKLWLNRVFNPPKI